MKRRTYLKAMLAAGTGSAVVRSASSSPPVVLSGELAVDPEKEGGMLKTFRNDFRARGRQTITSEFGR
jgi:hypothetical protein